jgi:catechol 2,3-dioxygenase-like lactoylglutathione lyase family enzyme
MTWDIHHLGVTVRDVDVDASAAWYVDVLGFRRVGEFESPEEHLATCAVRGSGGWCVLAASSRPEALLR